MPRFAYWTLATLALVGVLLVPATGALSQTAPATSAVTPSTPSPMPGTQSPSNMALSLPARGSVMNQVEARFGVPETKLPPVGEPPISRWVYKDFTVYFEYQHVIEAVVHQ